MRSLILLRAHHAGLSVAAKMCRQISSGENSRNIRTWWVRLSKSGLKYIPAMD